MTPDAELQIFAVKRGQIKGKEIFCSALYPYYLIVIEKYQASKYNRGLLKDFVDVNPPTCTRSLSDQDVVSFIPMSAVECLTNSVEYESVEYNKVKKGFTIFSKGDLLWAKITPCMQNGKSCLTDQMPTEIGFGSTEFHVLRVKKDKMDSVYMPFLWVLFSNKNILKAAQAVFNGSAGQQRVSDSFFNYFPAVLPDYSVQKNMFDRLNNKLVNYKCKLCQANELLAGMDEFVLDTFGIKPCLEAKKLCFAIKRKALDGVIDVKRHLGGMQLGNFKVQDIANIADQKINPQNFPDDIFDWIRIDDLPNHPLDITEIRTESGKNIEGTFFEVFPGDILVARLGPTILNRKTVMVRTTQRRTIASAEFLVLRCKEGFSPESVMAVIKTKFFVEQMYAHARGSTPSRYRLNREDMLSLPFPDISAVQEQIKAESIYRKKTAAKLRQEAEKEWQEAKEQFEKELLGE